MQIQVFKSLRLYRKGNYKKDVTFLVYWPDIYLLLLGQREVNVALGDTKSIDINYVIKYYTVVNAFIKSTPEKMSMLENL